jgi:transcriptional regulator with XRE-family HTH domain
MSRSNNLSTIVKKMREKQGLSQEKLARLADVSNNTIVNIETGKQKNPTIDTLRKIAKALNISITNLIK